MKEKHRRRILLKLSGEVLSGGLEFGIDPLKLQSIASEIRDVSKRNIEIALVLGGGNLFRGATLSSMGIDRLTGDQMGMLATVMNGLAMRDALLDQDVPTCLMSSFEIPGVTQVYDARLAVTALQAGKVTIFSGGTGNPFFTTDSSACLRGIEINADEILKATKVDYVYDKDPNLYKDAKPYKTLTYDEVLLKRLSVMDMTAICLARDYNKSIRIFNMQKPKGIEAAIFEGIGTLITSESSES